MRMVQARAKNEASFRTPDEEGWQPRQQHINAAQPLQSWLHTDLPLNALAASLAPAGLPVSLSGDAGLFVCNFTYYCSLRQAEAQREQQWQSLFVHVPPFEVIPAASQLRFAASLLDALAAMLSPGFAPFRMQPAVFPTAVA
jgi:pyroglutamyl-peptidase